MVRPLDKVGRVVTPKDLRTTMGMGELDSFEFFMEADTIILRKYHRGCTFCGEMHDLKYFGGRDVCGNCRDDLRKLIKQEGE
jgi:transcriptional pleiotropic regulator of transition state genes